MKLYIKTKKPVIDDASLGCVYEVTHDGKQYYFILTPETVLGKRNYPNGKHLFRTHEEYLPEEMLEAMVQTANTKLATNFFIKRNFLTRYKYMKREKISKEGDNSDGGKLAR